MSYPPLLGHILEGKDYGPMLKSLGVAEYQAKWQDLFRQLVACPPKDRAISDKFHTQWHVAHHFIRQLVNNDALLTDVLWVWLPRYNGPSLSLYRGENIDRFEADMIGSAWSDKKETALMFAGGLNAVGKGGTILQALAPALSIIAGPSKHSLYLGEREFTLDTRKLGKINRIRDFQPHPHLLFMDS